MHKILKRLNQGGGICGGGFIRVKVYEWWDLGQSESNGRCFKLCFFVFPETKT
jgi:hypothetical protein